MVDGFKEGETGMTRYPKQGCFWSFDQCIRCSSHIDGVCERRLTPDPRTSRQIRDEYVIVMLTMARGKNPDSKNPDVWEEMKITIRDGTPEELRQKVRTKIEFYGGKQKFLDTLMKFAKKDSLVASPDIFNMITGIANEVKQG
jgi:hypothetical protein